MENRNFTVAFNVDQTSQDVFNAVLNPSAWWSEEISGGTKTIDDIFDYHVEDIHHCIIKLIDVVPFKRVVWHVLENYFKQGVYGDPATNYPDEWINTDIIFDITENDGKTELKFTHEGLLPACACYEICKNGWTHYIGESLYNLIITGIGLPNPLEVK